MVIVFLGDIKGSGIYSSFLGQANHLQSALACNEESRLQLCFYTENAPFV